MKLLVTGGARYTRSATVHLSTSTPPAPTCPNPSCRPKARPIAVTERNAAPEAGAGPHSWAPHRNQQEPEEKHD